ncbi:MAG: ParA family protein [Armatimonadetes bacterium]|nr:ParA family protein [Armatimonadota bacterium]
MAAVIAVANQKGGTGKTTTAVNLSVCLAEGGLRVLLVDADSQANATLSLGVDYTALERSMYDVLAEGVPLGEIVRATDWGVVLAPATLALATAEMMLFTAFRREQVLADALAPLLGGDEEPVFDVVIVDCPPSLGLLSINGLVAADWLIAPVPTEALALEGVGQLLQSVEVVQRRLNPRLRVMGLLATRFDPRERLAHEALERLRADYGQPVFETVIRKNVRLAEAPAFGQPVTVYAPGSAGAEDYRRLAREVAARLGLSLSPIAGVEAGSGQGQVDGTVGAEESVVVASEAAGGDE